MSFVLAVVKVTRDFNETTKTTKNYDSNYGEQQPVDFESWSEFLRYNLAIDFSAIVATDTLLCVPLLFYYLMFLGTANEQPNRANRTYINKLFVLFSSLELFQKQCTPKEEE